MRRRGLTLVELLVSMGLFILVTSIALAVLQAGQASIARSEARMSTEQCERTALERLTPLLAAAYIPLASGVTTFWEAPNPPYPAGTDAFGSSQGPGTDSMMFWAPTDLLDANVTLATVCSWTSGLPYNATSGPKLYEVRLDRTYANDPLAAYQIDQIAVPGGTPPLLLRTLTIREMYLPDPPGQGPYAYLVPPNKPNASPQPSQSPVSTTPQRTLGRGLSDVRFFLSPTGAGVNIVVSAQEHDGAADGAGRSTVKTTTLAGVVYKQQGR